MEIDIIYRKANLSDANKLSILLKQVYIQTYGTEGVSDEFAKLWVLDSNLRAIAFYERQHYKWIGNAPFQMEKNLYNNKVMWKEW